MNKILKLFICEFIKEALDEQESPHYSWALDPTDGVEIVNFYLSKDKVKFLVFDPVGLVPEEGKKKLRGCWQGRGYLKFSSSRELVAIDLKNKTFVLRNSIRDPRIVETISSTIQLLPQFADFNVSYQGEWIRGDQFEWEVIGKAKDLVKSKKLVQGKALEYDRENERYKEFKYEVFEDITEIPWFHATLKKNIPSIMSQGLLPSGEQPQGSGWTQLNMHLQKAVYLTASPDYVQEIAETLADRFEEDAVVVKIDGSALSDRTRLVVDEDILRDEFGMNYSNLIEELPDFMASVLSRIESLGYKGVIAPKFLEVVYETKYEAPQEKTEEEY